MIWILNSNGVWSYYEHFRNASWKLFTRRCIWSSYVPKKVSFFVETALLYKILTINNLIKRNIPSVNCCMCKANNESVDHLLLHCIANNDSVDFLLLPC